MPISSGRPCRGQPGLYRSDNYREVVWGFHLHPGGYHQFGPGTGSRQPALWWQPRPTGASCNWPVIHRSGWLAKRILAWPVSSTKGMTWMLPNSTDNRVPNWRVRYCVDTLAAYGVFLARLKLAQGDVSGAVTVLDEAKQFVRQHNFVFRMPDVAAAQVLTLLRRAIWQRRPMWLRRTTSPAAGQGPSGPGRPVRSIGGAGPWRRHVEAMGWADERLKVMVLRRSLSICMAKRSRLCNCSVTH